MADLRSQAFNIFVLDEDDEPVALAQVTVVIDGVPAFMVTTGGRSTDDGRLKGIANAPVLVQLPEDVTNVVVRVAYSGIMQEQPVDLDAPNLTFRVTSRPAEATKAAARPEPSAVSRSESRTPAINPTALRKRVLPRITREDLAILCGDFAIEAELTSFSLDSLPVGGLEFQLGQLIAFAERRQKLPLLVRVIERAWPDGVAPEGSTAAASNAVAEAEAMASSLRSVSIKARVRLCEVPTSIYDLLVEHGHPLVTVELANQGDAPFAGFLNAQVLRFSDQQDRDIHLQAREARTVTLHPALDRRAITALTSMERASLRVHMESIDGRTVSRETLSLYLLPPTAAPLSMKDPVTEEWHDLRPYLARYVTPQAERVQTFLQTVLAHADGSPMVGYGGPPSMVEPQVRAIYEALRAHPIDYVPSTFVFNRAPDWSQQRLRLPSETLERKVANCLDGAVLFASLLEALELSAALVFTGSGDSAHAFVAWESMRDSQEWSYVETNAFRTQTFDAARQSAEERARAFEDESVTTRAPIYKRLSIRPLRGQGIEGFN